MHLCGIIVCAQLDSGGRRKRGFTVPLSTTVSVSPWLLLNGPVVLEKVLEPSKVLSLFSLPGEMTERTKFKLG